MNQIKLLKLTFVLSILFSFTQISSAQYYWVNGTGNWSQFASHWATTSGGNTFHTTSPTKEDDVFFDENSFSEDGQTVVLDDKSYCKSMTWTTTRAVEFNSQNHSLDILGSLVLQSQVQYKLSSVKFDSQNTVETIQSNGATFGANIYLYGSAEFKLLDDLSASVIWLSNCAFTTNDYNINLNRFRITGSPTVNLGSSFIHCSRWEDSGFNADINTGTSTISTNTFLIKDGNYGKVIYNNVVFENKGKIQGSGIFNKISVNVTDIGAELIFDSGATIRCNELTANSDKVHPFSMYIAKGTGYATIQKDSGEINLSYVSLKDIHGEGGATFNANPGIDNGNNDGWIFTEITPYNYYWVGDEGDWSDLSHWATTSGGTTKYTSLPTKFDHVFFDKNSFTLPNQNVNIGMDLSINNFISTSDDEFNLTGETNVELIVNGDINLTKVQCNRVDIQIDCVHQASLNFGENEVKVVKLIGGGNYNFVTDAKIRHLYVYGGVLNTNDYNLDIGFNLSIYEDNVLNLGSSTIETRIFEVMRLSTPTINAGTSTIMVSGSFKGGDTTYHHIILKDKGRIYGDNTFSILEILPGTDAKFEFGKTQTITDELILNGTSTDYIHLSSTTEGSPTTLAKASGTITGNYLVLKDNIATGGATFTADKSIDLGNNMGWNIIKKASRDFYWIGGSGDWMDVNHWAISSGSTTLYNEVPSILDNVIFDENSFSADNQTVTIPTLSDLSFHTMDWSKVAYNVTLGGGLVIKLNVYGSLIFGEKITPNIKFINFLGNGEHEFEAGKDGNLGDATIITFDGDGIWDINSAINTDKIEYKHGTVNTNGNELHVSNTVFSSLRKKDINLGTTDYYASRFEFALYNDSLTINAGQATVFCEKYFTASKKSSNVLNIDIKKVHFVNPDIVGSIKSDIEIGILEIDPGKEISIDKDLEMTVSELIAKGNESKPIKIHSQEAGIQCSIKQVSGEVHGEYLELQDIEGLGGAKFYATNSTNLGNVTGWIFGPVSTSSPFYTNTKSYPNPTNDRIFIETTNTQKGNYEIYNSLGEMVETAAFENGHEILEIPMFQLNSGVYFVKIKRGNDFYQVRVLKE